MNIAEAKQQVKDTIEAYLATDDAGIPRIPASRQRPLFLVGAPGIGKTAIMSQIAEELGIGLVSYSMTHHTRQSALGLPFIVHRDYGEESFDVSEYTMSEIIASVYDYMDATGLRRGILFLDEINCVSETLYPSMLQFLQFKTFGRHRVPDGWVVACAGNPPEYNKSVHEFDIVTLDRLRTIEVEPSYEPWKTYATEAGVHPAITTFLEVKPECFYAVESTPEGKLFATARGWDDLSDTIKVFEDLGKPVDKRLVSQFIQHAEIAEKFAVYYDLFNKYRSDYQIDAILAGGASDEIVARAQEAAFDERLALLSLVLDGLSTPLGAAVEQEEVTVTVRDLLRDAKPELLDGASLADAVEARIAAREERFARRERSGTLAAGIRRRERRAVEVLKDLATRCKLARQTEGAAAFDVINSEYRGFTRLLDPLVDEATAKLDNAFAFVEGAFGDSREMMVFVTELTARPTTAAFINRFGSESYYAHNEKLQVDERRHNLTSRIANLGLGSVREEGAARGSAQAGVAAGADRSAEAARPVADGGFEGSAAAAAGAPAHAAETAVASAGADDAGDDNAAYADALRAHYGSAAFEYGFASLCKMTLPDDLLGKRVLDIGCRRGKGVFKLSSRVGNSGHVVGVDWVPEYIEEANARMDRAWRDSGLLGNNMEFHVAYPEDLRMAGVADESVDVVVVNSSINLAYDLGRAYREIARVLKPGGLLVSEAVMADDVREVRVVEQARAIGNGIQAAPSRTSLETMLSDAGFGTVSYFDLREVEPTEGFTASHKVEVVPSEENVRFLAGVLHARKGEGTRTVRWH